MNTIVDQSRKENNHYRLFTHANFAKTTKSVCRPIQNYRTGANVAAKFVRPANDTRSEANAGNLLAREVSNELTRSPKTMFFCCTAHQISKFKQAQKAEITAENGSSAQIA
ncbi:hypothetical protein [Roseibium sp.]|uniref:hypothetical protein n=1 Tax=Roseibium sp. TaxID=1936156 RepID=UPI003B519841